jgi:hypothetical protein
MLSKRKSNVFKTGHTIVATCKWHRLHAVSPKNFKCYKYIFVSASKDAAQGPVSERGHFDSYMYLHGRHALELVHTTYFLFIANDVSFVTVEAFLAMKQRICKCCLGCESFSP